MLDPVGLSVQSVSGAFRLVWLVREAGAALVPVVFGTVAAVLAGTGYAVLLWGSDVQEFFSVGAQIVIGVLLAIALEMRKGSGADAIEIGLQILGLLTVLGGAVSALAGLLAGPHPAELVCAAFALTWGGLFAGFASLMLLFVKRGGSGLSEHQHDLSEALGVPSEGHKSH